MSNIVMVDFRNDTLFAVEREDGVFVAIKPICDAMGLPWHGQRERINRNPILSEGGRMIRLPSGGGTQETLCLRLDLVNGWLFTIDENRLRDDEIRQLVLVYKRECYAALFRHFYGRAAKAQLIDPPEDAEEAVGPKIRMVTEARNTFGVPSAAQLWFKLGLPVVPAMLHDPRQVSIDFSVVKTADAEPKAG